MGKLVLTQGEHTYNVGQYALPKKYEAVELNINGRLVEGRVTTWKDLKYTYFGLEGGQFYVPGVLEPEHPIIFPLPPDFSPVAVQTREAVAERIKARKAQLKAEAEANGEAPKEKKPRGRKKGSKAAAEDEAAQAQAGAQWDTPAA